MYWVLHTFGKHSFFTFFRFFQFWGEITDVSGSRYPQFGTIFKPVTGVCLARTRVRARGSLYITPSQKGSRVEGPPDGVATA